MEQLTLFEMATPSMPTLDVTRCYTRLVNHATAANMVEQYHYAHRVPSITLAVGMYVDKVLAGVCTYGCPASPNVQRLCGDQYRKSTWELNRLFIHEWAGKNSESWLVGQSFKVISKYAPDISILVSYADTAEKHIGSIYQATNWLYCGESEIERMAGVELADGRILHRRTLGQLYGDQSILTVADNLGTNFIRVVEGKPKHRYVMFLGNKREKRALREALKWPVLPYPKAQQTNAENP